MIWERSEMLTLREIGMYRYFLMQQQEKWRRNGSPPMFLLVYDMCLRKSLARRTELQDPSLNVDAVLGEVNNATWLEAENEMPLYQNAFNSYWRGLCVPTGPADLLCWI